MIYAYVIAAIALFGAGFGTAHQLDKAEILAMENAISAQKVEAAAMLQAETDRVNLAMSKAHEFNNQLEVSHAQSISTINAIHDQLATASLRDTGRRKSSGGATGNSASAGIAETTANASELSTELAQFLKSEAYRADTAAEYANSCFGFLANLGTR